MGNRNSTLHKRSTRIRRFDPHLLPGPREATVNTILNYSKALQVVDAPPVGQVEVVLN